MGEQRILVVEDHGPLLMAVQEILEVEGYTVLTATDGAEALQVMEESRPDLIVTDILMPRMDGYAFCEAIRAQPEWEPIPLIFLTAKAEMEDVLKGKDLGVESYITKPFEPEELLAAVRSVLERAGANR
ncbi:MAG: response regulator transcription factor [Anaerolineae bacterium]